MDRNTIVRWILIAGIMLGGYWFFYGRKSSETPQQLPQETYVDAPDFAPDAVDTRPGQPVPPRPTEGELCSIHGNRFDAELSSRGAGLRHFYLTDAQYTDPKSRDIATTPDVERWRNLRTLFRDPTEPAHGTDDQVKYDRVEWKLEQLGETGCKFSYE